MLRSIFRFLGNALNHLLTLVSRVASLPFSNRSLALLAMAGCVVLITGPWLRPPITRDIRALHIPFGELTSVSFSPEYLVDTPRPLRWDSIATPLLVVAAVGSVFLLVAPRWTANIFGVLAALSMAALAVAFWNYPALIDSFDSEMRDRAELRAVFRQHSEHMLSAGTPDRLAALGNKATRADLLMVKEHPLLIPIKYSVYGPWLIGLALAAVVVSARGSPARRLGFAGAWAMAGVFLAVSATWPRLLAEYYVARAESFENSNRFEEAESALQSAQGTMPSLKSTWRYWLAQGRLSVRQHRLDNRFASFYLAHQALLGADFTRARALLEPYVRSTGASMAERDLFAGILAQTAAVYVSDAKYGAAEIYWGEATAIAPWKVAYTLAHGASQIAAAPERAHLIDDELKPTLENVGDIMVASDYHTLVGDAHFVVGEFAKARERYDAAIDLFQMPKYINVQAQEGRLGM